MENARNLTLSNGTTIYDDTDALISSLSFSIGVFLICLTTWFILSYFFKKFYFYKAFRYEGESWAPTIPKHGFDAIAKVFRYDEGQILEGTGCWIDILSTHG